MGNGRQHEYLVTVEWTGDRGSGTSGYRAYGRDHEVRSVGRPTLRGSSDPAFRGDTDRWNPEQLLVTSLSQCHMLWYLHLACEAGIIVLGYEDHAVGTMVEDVSGGGGQFASVTLRPSVLVSDVSMTQRALAVHSDVGAQCFIARSVNFPVYHEPSVTVAKPT